MNNETNSLPVDANDLTGVQKAAILLISLGVEKAAKVLKKLNESEVEQLTIAIAEMEDVESDLVEGVRNEYHELIKSREYIVEGGTDYARDLLMESVGREKADQVLKKHEYDKGVDAFGLFKSVNITQATRFLRKESPQVAAVILAHMEVGRAAEVLAALPDDFQTEITYRLANMSQISSEVVEELRETIKEEIGSDYSEIDEILKGVPAVAGILNESDIATERQVLDSISELDDELADDIKQQMFLFEDILDLEDRTMQEIIANLGKDDMVMGLKGQDEKLKQKFIDNMSQRASEILLDDLDALGPVHVSQVEEAQRNIVRIIKELEEEGQITIRKKGDETIIE